MTGVEECARISQKPGLQKLTKIKLRKWQENMNSVIRLEGA